MPHWSDIARRHGKAPEAQPAREPARPAAAVAAAPSLPGTQGGRLDALLKERQALETRMQKAVTGGAGTGDPRDALRFQVAPMAERRAEIARWETLRDARSRTETPKDTPQTAIPEPASGDPPLRDRLAERPKPRPEPALPLRGTPGETARGTPTGAARFLSRRGAGLRKLRAVGEDTEQRLEARLSRARTVAAERLRSGSNEMDRQITSVEDQFEKAERRLASEGHADARDDLRRMRSESGLDGAMGKADQGRDALGKAGRMIDEGPTRAKRKIEDGWSTRRDAISGPDTQRVERPMRALRDRALGMSLDDFDRRARAARAAAAERRRSAQAEAAADDQRRERALSNRRTNRNAD